MSIWQRIVWFLGGFDTTLLRREECRTVRSKYSSIGSLVLMTALLSTCSAGYAIHSILHRLDLAAPFAALWGLFVLSLDRYLISSSRKLATVKEFYSTLQTTPPYQERHSWGAFLALGVRLLLASLIGLVVAIPLEMKILEPWVDDYEQAQAEAHEQQLKRESNADAIAADIKGRQAALNKRRDEIQDSRTLLRQEIDGSRPSGKKGFGPIAQQQERLLRDAERDFARDQDLLNKEVDRLQGEQTKTAERAKADRQRREASRSVISSLGVVHEIRKGGGTKADLVGIVSLFLTIFFVIVEITPVLSKAVTQFDVYDALLLGAEHPSILHSLSAARRAHGDAMADIAGV